MTLGRKEARVLASAEFARFGALAASLSPEEWATATDCVGWDVRTMVLHVLGSADAEVVARLQDVGVTAVKGRFGTPLPMRYARSRSAT